MVGAFWKNARKMGAQGFHGASEVGEKLKKEGPQQVAQNRDKFDKKKNAEKKAEDRIPGGKADDEPDSKFPKGELRKGKKHEKEHTSDPEIAKEIAKDHIKEDSSYYEKLDKVEKEK